MKAIYGGDIRVQAMRTQGKWESLEAVKLDRTAWFKALNSYIDFYSKLATYDFWVWLLQRRLRQLDFTMEEFEDAMMRGGAVSNVCACVCE